MPELCADTSSTSARLWSFVERGVLNAALYKSRRAVIDFCDGGCVFWWFERGGKFLRYETRTLPGGTCELRVTTPDGVEHVETFPDSSSLTARQVKFEREFIEEGWTGPHGWNL